MLWAIASSIFIIYLFRQLNAVTEPAAVRGDASVNAVDAELARLNDRISALEIAANARTLETSP